jgi:hypothetical protein
MTAKSDIEVVANQRRNLLTVRFHGRITAEAMKSWLGQIEEMTHFVRLGFTVLTDLTDLVAMELECVEPIARMMELFKAVGVATVVRVIPDPEKDIGFKILSLTHYRRTVRIITCDSLAEAEQVLAMA